MKRELVRIKDNSIMFGVCSGIAEYFNLELSKIRMAWIISILFFGTGLFLYIVLALVLPKKQYEAVSNVEII